MQFQSHYNRFLLSLEGTKNIYVSFCENIISFCAPRTFRFADYMWMNVGTTLFFHTKECKALNFEPFSRPLGQVMEEKVTAEVSKLADINRRYYEMMAEK